MSKLHFRRSQGKCNQGFKERLKFAVVWAAGQSGQECFVQHFAGNAHGVALVAVVAAVLLLTATSAHAEIVEFVIQPTDAKESSFWWVRSGDKTIDGVGLGTAGAASVETGEPIPENWPAHGSGHIFSYWMSENTLGEGNEWIMFDLGAEYLLGGLHQWNYNESSDAATNNGIKDLTIKFATSSAGYDADDVTHSVWGNAFDTTFAVATGSSTYTGQTIDFDSARTARYVLFDTTNTHHPTGYNRTGLSEIRFTAIPEPSSLILLAAGFLGLLGLRRRRGKE